MWKEYPQQDAIIKEEENLNELKINPPTLPQHIITIEITNNTLTLTMLNPSKKHNDMSYQLFFLSFLNTEATNVIQINPCGH